MSDLVKRLRQSALYSAENNMHFDAEELTEAADRIEQLERENAELWERYYKMRRMAGAALYGDRLQNQVKTAKDATQ